MVLWDLATIVNFYIADSKKRADQWPALFLVNGNFL